MTEIDRDAPVLVTGATGYVGSWVVRDLLEEGLTVRGTVRDPQKPTGLEHLHKLADEFPHKLTLHAADLLDQGSFSEAMKGCQLVIHTASPFFIGKIHDAQKELIRPALEGTKNVLDSVNQTESVRRVVLTSSVAAIYGDAVESQGRGPFTDADWNTSSSETHQPYPYSKTVAEREAWEMAGAQSRWDLVTVHPGLVVGPSLTNASRSGSMGTLHHFTDYSLTFGAPALTLGMVDVRDVATAHVQAGLRPEAKGRYIANAESLSFLQIGRILRAKFGNKLSFPRFEAPKALVVAFGPISGESREFLRQNVGYRVAFDNSRTTADLGIQFRPVAESICTLFAQMRDEGHGAH